MYRLPEAILTMIIYENSTVAVGLRAVAEPGAERSLATQRRAVAALMKELFKGEAPPIGHTPDGAPTLPGGRSVSVSHCRHAVAVAVDTAGRRIGVDVDTLGRDVTLSRVAPRFLSPGQMAAWSATAGTLLTAWSIKEALYKAVGQRGWSLADIPLPADCQNFLLSGKAEVEAFGHSYRLLSLPSAGGCGPVILALG